MPDIEEIQGIENAATEGKDHPEAENNLLSRQRFLKLCSSSLAGLALLGVTGCGGGEQEDQGGEQDEGQDGGGENDDNQDDADQNDDDQDDDDQDDDDDDDGGDDQDDDDG